MSTDRRKGERRTGSFNVGCACQRKDRPLGEPPCHVTRAGTVNDRRFNSDRRAAAPTSLDTAAPAIEKRQQWWCPKCEKRSVYIVIDFDAKPKVSEWRCACGWSLPCMVVAANSGPQQEPAASVPSEEGRMPSCHNCGTIMRGVCPKCETTTCVVAASVPVQPTTLRVSEVLDAATHFVIRWAENHPSNENGYGASEVVRMIAEFHCYEMPLLANRTAPANLPEKPGAGKEGR